MMALGCITYPYLMPTRPDNPTIMWTLSSRSTVIKMHHLETKSSHVGMSVPGKKCDKVFAFGVAFGPTGNRSLDPPAQGDSHS